MAIIQYAADGELGTITFDDPPLNVFGERHWQELADAVDRAAQAEHRALLIRANGPNFSRGAELALFHGRSATEARTFLERLFQTVHKLETLPCPVIAAVQGLCQASGLELALACDLILSSESARFGQPEAMIGATTFLGGTQRLARRCGDARAREIVFTAGLFDAASFERWNIVNRVVPDDALEREALTLAKRLAAGPTRAHAVTKHLVHRFHEAGLQAADAAVLDKAAKLWESHDMVMAVAQLLTVDRTKLRSTDITFTGR